MNKNCIQLKIYWLLNELFQIATGLLTTYYRTKKVVSGITVTSLVSLGTSARYNPNSGVVYTTQHHCRIPLPLPTPHPQQVPGMQLPFTFSANVPIDGCILYLKRLYITLTCIILYYSRLYKCTLSGLVLDSYPSFLMTCCSRLQTVELDWLV